MLQQDRDRMPLLHPLWGPSLGLEMCRPRGWSHYIFGRYFPRQVSEAQCSTSLQPRCMLGIVNNEWTGIWTSSAFWLLMMNAINILSLMSWNRLRSPPIIQVIVQTNVPVFNERKRSRAYRRIFQLVSTRIKIIKCRSIELQCIDKRHYSCDKITSNVKKILNKQIPHIQMQTLHNAVKHWNWHDLSADRSAIYSYTCETKPFFIFGYLLPPLSTSLPPLVRVFNKLNNQWAANSEYVDW